MIELSLKSCFYCFDYILLEASIIIEWFGQNVWQMKVLNSSCKWFNLLFIQSAKSFSKQNDVFLVVEVRVVIDLRLEIWELSCNDF